MGWPTGKAKEVLDAAEGFARTQGFNGFSFRDLAARVGIKSASVHYHFPTKGALGAALARRYTDRFLAAVGDPTDPRTAPAALLESYVGGFRRALVEDGQMCLCGMLGAEIDSLPAAVADEARIFFERNIDWLEAVFSRLDEPSAPGSTQARRRALATLATLEGAMIIARTLERPDIFDEIVSAVTPEG